jgi:hypothetical protein
MGVVLFRRRWLLAVHISISGVVHVVCARSTPSRRRWDRCRWPRGRPTALDLPAVAVTDHPPEHAIETQLPLMLLALGPWITLLPVLVGHPRPRRSSRSETRLGAIGACGAAGAVRMPQPSESHGYARKRRSMTLARPNRVLFLNGRPARAMKV